MNAQTALDLISPIPADQFIKGRFTNSIGACCFIGHLQRLTSSDPNNYSYENCEDNREHPIRNTSNLFMRNIHAIPYDIVDVNNKDNVNGYNEPLIKDRLVHCLTDMIAAGY